MEANILSPFIGSGMVIQRDMAFPIYSSQKVSVTFLGKTYQSENINSKWLIKLDPAQAGGPYTLEISFDGQNTQFEDIYIGDVWLCSGQSNMELDMTRLKNDFSEEWTGNYPPIRQFKVPRQLDFSSPHDDINGDWHVPSDESLNWFSAVAWFFAKNLYKKYGIPIGLVNSTWGGTPVEAWMSEQALCDYPEKIAQGKQFIDPSKEDEMKKKLGDSFFIERQPTGTFNAMLSPLLKYPFKGVIWYQGESNDPAPHCYEKLFKLMIQDWRKKNNSDLPFFFVQLPIWKEATDNDENAPWAILREAQMNTLSLPKTGMACALELGEWNELHPLNKKDIGYRLFLAADKVLNSVDNTSPGAVVREYKLENKEQKIYIYFNNCGNRITTIQPPSSLCASASLRDENLNIAYVSVVNNEGQFRLPAKIEGKDFISIDVSSVKNPKKVLYAFADNPKDRNLFNSEGLPVLPFRFEII
ncbi:MAG: sialate O-acetylesterase [Treponema sp.]|nr:sialate O-acetylesterase [Treponema sp.]